MYHLFITYLFCERKILPYYFFAVFRFVTDSTYLRCLRIQLVTTVPAFPIFFEENVVLHGNYDVRVFFFQTYRDLLVTVETK